MRWSKGEIATGKKEKTDPDFRNTIAVRARNSTKGNGGKDHSLVTGDLRTCRVIFIRFLRVARWFDWVQLKARGGSLRHRVLGVRLGHLKPLFAYRGTNHLTAHPDKTVNRRKLLRSRKCLDLLRSTHSV